MKWSTFIFGLLCALVIGMALALSGAHASCGDSKACWSRVREHHAWQLCVKRHGARYCTYRNRFNRQPSSWRGYAAAVFACEGGDGPNDHGNGFIYRAEWSPSTAWSAGLRHGYPTWHEEALAVIRWTKRVGFHTTTGWPNCP
jgi:hypothetical protein